MGNAMPAGSLGSSSSHRNPNKCLKCFGGSIGVEWQEEGDAGKDADA